MPGEFSNSYARPHKPVSHRLIHGRFLRTCCRDYDRLLNSWNVGASKACFYFVHLVSGSYLVVRARQKLHREGIVAIFFEVRNRAPAAP